MRNSGRESIVTLYAAHNYYCMIFREMRRFVDVRRSVWDDNAMYAETLRSVIDVLIFKSINESSITL